MNEQQEGYLHIKQVWKAYFKESKCSQEAYKLMWKLWYEMTEDEQMEVMIFQMRDHT